MYKKALFVFAAFALLSVLLAACTIRDASVASGPSVHMNTGNFVQPTVTIKKGQTLTLIDDATSPHIVVNGSWVNGQAVNKAESGAPTVKLNFNGGDSLATAPFNTAGTFHIYCTIHSGMNLAVTVQ